MWPNAGVAGAAHLARPWVGGTRGATQRASVDDEHARLEDRTRLYRVNPLACAEPPRSPGAGEAFVDV